MKRKAALVLVAVMVCLRVLCGCGVQWTELPATYQVDDYEMTVENYVVVNIIEENGTNSHVYGFYKFPDSKTVGEMNKIVEPTKEYTTLNTARYDQFGLSCGKAENQFKNDVSKPTVLANNRVVVEGTIINTGKEGDMVAISFDTDTTSITARCKLTKDHIIEVNRGGNIVHKGDAITQTELDFIKKDLYLS